jgi:hypothetical protein
MWTGQPMARQLGFIVRQYDSITAWKSSVGRFWVATMTIPSRICGAASGQPEAGTAEIGCRSSGFALVGDALGC